MLATIYCNLNRSTGCLKARPMQKQLIRVQIVLLQNWHQCQRLPLEYMQTHVYYTHYTHTDTWTRTCVNVNAGSVTVHA